MPAVFIGLLLLGNVALLAGMILTRLHWRPDIPPYGRRTRFLDVTLHPEAYAKDAPLRVIRTLNWTGSLLLFGAVGLVVYDVLRTIARR